MSTSRLPPSRFLLVPAVVFLLGVGCSVAAFLGLESRARLAMFEQVNNAGEQVVQKAIEATHVALDQVLATKGLFESSDQVTASQFARFVETISGDHESSIGYAPRVATGSGHVWRLLYRSGLPAGFPLGFDFGSHPMISAAIEESVTTGQAAATPFLEIPGDDEPGDILIVSIIGNSPDVNGLAMITLQLDEILSGPAKELLGSQTVVTLSQSPQAADHFDEEHWRGEFEIAGQTVFVSIEGHDVPTISPLAKWILVFGIGVSVLLGWAISGLTRRNALDRHLTSLQKSLAEKDRFLAGVSHALRTPMTSILGTLEILDDDQIPIEHTTKSDLIHDARISALDLERLTDDYLIAARITSGAITVKKSPLDLDFLIRQIIASTDVPSGVNLTVEPLGKCSGDISRLRHVIRNLIRNATQHALTTIVIRAALEPGFIRIDVINDGPPIPTEIVDQQLFKPFGKATMPTQPESMGLGLSVARDLARLMGGDLTYNHLHGQVIFQLTLPNEPLPTHQPVPPLRPPHGSRRSAARVEQHPPPLKPRRM